MSRFDVMIQLGETTSGDDEDRTARVSCGFIEITGILIAASYSGSRNAYASAHVSKRTT